MEIDKTLYFSVHKAIREEDDYKLPYYLYFSLKSGGIKSVVLTEEWMLIFFNCLLKLFNIPDQDNIKKSFEIFKDCTGDLDNVWKYIYDSECLFDLNKIEKIN